jgi:hypothetical protein
MKSQPSRGRGERCHLTTTCQVFGCYRLPRHTANVASSTGGHLCHSSQSCPLFCGNGIPLTNEVMDWGGEGCCQSVTHTVRHSLINWISLLNQRYRTMCVHQILVLVCAILRSRVLCFAATVYLWQMKDGLSCILYTRGDSEGHVGRAVWCNNETEVVTIIRQSMWQHCGDQSTAYPM